MSKPVLRVAIVGGGLAGTVLMNALIKHPHLDVQIYEANPEIQERGAAVGLSINAQRAMRLIGLGDVPRRAGAVKVGCLRLIVGEGPDTGTRVDDVDFGKETVHRAALLRELLVAIPGSRINLNKRLASIQGTTMTFADGTSVDADVIIGADGIHSGVRRYVLGEGHPAVPPVPSGFWDTRTIITYEEALAKLGPSCIDNVDPHQHIHIGGKGIFLHDIISNGESCCIIASGPVPSDWDVTKWTHTVARKWLDVQYKDWGEFGQKSLDLVFGDREEIPAFVQWESAKAPILYNGTICMIGDAAHATSPWQGSGLSQAIEDSLIVERLLGLCTNIDEVPLALEVYDQIRRGRAQAVVDSSRKAAESYFSAWPGGAAQLRTDIPLRDHILNWDTEGAVNQAIENFELLRRTERPR